MKLRPGQIRNANTFEPYIHEQYNIHLCYFDKNFPVPEENMMARVLNALIKELNDNARHPLPRLIVIIIGKEFFKMLNHVDYGVSHMIGKCLDWLMASLERLIHTRKMDIFHKRPGAVCYFEPKFIWVKMMEEKFPQVFRENSAKAMLTRKFNVILEQLLEHSGSGFIMNGLPFNKLNFDRNCKLNHEGRIAFWKHISGKLHKFNHHQDTLEPRCADVARQEDNRNLRQHSSHKPVTMIYHQKFKN